MNGGSQADAMRTAKLLSLKCLHAHLYQNAERRLGGAMNTVSKFSMSEALKEEISKTKETYRCVNLTLFLTSPVTSADPCAYVTSTATSVTS